MPDEHDNGPWVVRTDFSNETAWRDLKQAISAPHREPGTDLEFLAHVQFVEQQRYGGLKVEALVRELPADYPCEFLFVADAETFRSPERPIVVVGFASAGETDDGVQRVRGELQTFRAIPATIQSIENNLSIANMDYADFANSVQADGVFHGFPA
ncbi:MAG: DUF6924 domain-containing protein [Planctomycetaceae bacterium]